MKEIELIDGEVYHTLYNNNSWIVTYKEDHKNEPSLCINSSYFDGDGEWGWNHTESQSARIATPQEKAWLNACIKAGVFVSKDDINCSTDSLDIF